MMANGWERTHDQRLIALEIEQAKQSERVNVAIAAVGRVEGVIQTAREEQRREMRELREALTEERDDRGKQRDKEQEQFAQDRRANRTVLWTLTGTMVVGVIGAIATILAGHL